MQRKLVKINLIYFKRKEVSNPNAKKTNRRKLIFCGLFLPPIAFAIYEHYKSESLKRKILRLNFSYGSKIVVANGFSTGEIRQFVNIYTTETEYKTIQIPLGRIMVEKNQGLMFVPQESFDNSIIWL